jgi:enoyl-CoA hydratase/carnithine racemase
MNWKRTYEYLYTKPRLTAEQALDFGLVNRVVDRDKLEAEAQALAAEIATAPLTALRATKLMVKRAWELMGMRAHLQWSNDMLTSPRTTPTRANACTRRSPTCTRATGAKKLPCRMP